MNSSEPWQSFTQFDDQMLALRRTWSDCDVAPGYIWERTSENGSFESGAFDVVDRKSGQTGKAKPDRTGLSDVARAAHEKIASDLAALPELDLPIPPVTLYDRGNTAKKDRWNEKREKADSPPYISVSAWAFPACDYAVFNSLTSAQKETLVQPFSAMHVFETWIAAGNAHLSHVLIDARGERPRLAWIDHAHSLSQQWEWTPKEDSIKPTPWYLLGFAPDPVIKQATARKIGSISNEKIEKIVGRIKPEWLSSERVSLIMEKLKQRRDVIYRLYD